MFIALTMVPPSVYQMMRGIIVVITALLSIIFLNRTLYRHHWTSLAFIVAGVAQVGYVSITYTKNHGGNESTSGGSELMGIILLLTSQCFTGA
jgi:drug/metabolite transporter (DMT)-like permease